jgi:anti-sigma B factor antagonist
MSHIETTMNETSLKFRPVAINGELNIYTAAEWRDRLASEIAGSDDVELDLTGVEEIDTAGLQLLIATCRQLANEGRQMHIGAVSAGVRMVLEFSSLTFLLPGTATLPSLPKAA